MGAPWTKEWKEGKDTGKDTGEKGDKGKDQDKIGTKEVYKESYGKEASKDAGKGESKDIEIGPVPVPGPTPHTLVALHRRIAALEAALGIGAPFIAQEERPDVGAAVVNQPVNKK